MTFWGYNDGINRNKRTICDVYGTYWSAHRRSSKVQAWIILLFLSFVLRLQGWNVFSLLFTMVLSSDNSIVCFRRKAFLKSDTLAGFTTRVALIWYLTCGISWKLDFYRNLFEFGALHFLWLLAKWDATVPHIPERFLHDPLTPQHATDSIRPHHGCYLSSIKTLIKWIRRTQKLWE